MVLWRRGVAPMGVEERGLVEGEEMQRSDLILQLPLPPCLKNQEKND